MKTGVQAKTLGALFSCHASVQDLIDQVLPAQAGAHLDALGQQGHGHHHGLAAVGDVGAPQVA